MSFEINKAEVNRRPELAIYLVKLYEKLKYIENSILNKHSMLTSNQYKILSIIKEKQPCSINTVSKLGNISLSTASLTVDKLVKNKWLNRSNSKIDRRQVCIELTGKSKKIFEKIEKLVVKLSNQIINDLDDKEQNLINLALRKIFVNKTT
jgi:DNA-binding MarR family transcriptional regulator